MIKQLFGLIKIQTPNQLHTLKKKDNTEIANDTIIIIDKKRIFFSI